MLNKCIRPRIKLILNYFMCMPFSITRLRPNLNSITARHVLQQRTPRWLPTCGSFGAQSSHIKRPQDLRQTHSYTVRSNKIHGAADEPAVMMPIKQQAKSHMTAGACSARADALPRCVTRLKLSPSQHGPPRQPLHSDFAGRIFKPR